MKVDESELPIKLYGLKDNKGTPYELILRGYGTNWVEIRPIKKEGFYCPKCGHSIPNTDVDNNHICIPKEPVLPIRWWCSLCGKHLEFNNTEEIDNHVKEYHSNTY